MSTVQDFESLDALAAYLSNAMRTTVAASELRFQPAGNDDRIGWINQQFVTIDGLGVAGFALVDPLDPSIDREPFQNREPFYGFPPTAGVDER